MATSLSISMVIWAATGGRASLLGACVGALIVNFVGSLASESATFQPVWPIILGLLFVFVVLFMPNGIAGIFKAFIERSGNAGKTERFAEAKPSTQTVRKGGVIDECRS